MILRDLLLPTFEADIDEAGSSGRKQLRPNTGRLIDYERFLYQYWDHFPQNLTRALGTFFAFGPSYSTS